MRRLGGVILTRLQESAFFGREKFINGEVDPLEQIAGVVVSCADTFFLRNTEVIARNHQLNLSLQFNDGEDAQRYEYALGFAVDNECIVKDAAYGFRNTCEVEIVVTAAVAVSAA